MTVYLKFTRNQIQQVFSFYITKLIFNIGQHFIVELTFYLIT